MIRSSAGRALLGPVFAHMSFAIPVHRLRETSTLMAFHHPQPSYPVHILLVPKKAIASLAAVTPADSDFRVDLFSAVQSLVVEFGLEKSGCRLITNGSPYQAIPQLHFHLISEAAAQLNE
jgi:histidine triad (HIT) family protein